MADTAAAKRIECVIPGCGFKETAPTDAELLQKVAAHAAEAHGVTEIPPDLAAKVREAIQDVKP